jgi:UDP-N-acetylglucosamine diphosphorylase/glucosamine-1-phosphate N-acetyltransferase
VLFDDATGRTFEPFALTRPLGETRVGAMLVRERWARVLGLPATAFVSSANLAPFDEPGAPRSVRKRIAAGTVLVNTRFLPALDSSIGPLAAGNAVRIGRGVAAVVLTEDLDASALSDGAFDLASLAKRGGLVTRGWRLDAAWDIVRLLPDMLAADAAVLARDIAAEPPAHVQVLGAHRLAVEPGAHLEPYVVVDTTAGDVVVRAGARVGAFARIAGPAVIGEHTQVAGGRYSCVSLGPQCRTCGEMSVVVMTGYANKGHDGFIGHSVIGRWANLGAGTITSNLKNSYGTVRVRDGHGEHDTGMQFLGSLIGDHAKTAIGTRLMTGTIVGAGANVFGDRSPGKHVPPLAWGDRAPFATYETDKFLDVARLVMKRRDVTLGAGMRAVLRAAAAAPAPPRSRRGGTR